VEEVCANCPLREKQIGTIAGEYIVELTRARVEDADDRASVLALPAGETMLAALGQVRPDRCDVLDRNLAGRRSRHAYKRAVRASDCPEVALGARLQTEYPEDLPEQLW